MAEDRMTHDPRLKIKVQIYCGEEIAMGPGKAALLGAIIRTGSISAAGRALGMSYRRTWLLVDVMNRCWAEPLVTTATGGTRGGGAVVTTFGREVLEQYLQLTGALAATGKAADPLLPKLLAVPHPAQHR